MKPYHLSLTYTLRNSWAVASNDAVSEEEAVPVVLVDNSGLWKPAYPHSVLQDGAEKPKESVKSKTKDAAPMSSAFRVFSYRMEEMTVPPHLHHTRIRRGPSDTLQLLHEAHCHSTFTIKGLPFGNIFSVSDGPKDNSTGVLYFYVTLMDNTVADLRSFPFASHFLRGRERLLQMGEVDPEEVEFAKEAMFSRHPVMKKWLVGHNWFVMKLQLTQVWLQDWVGGVSLIPLEDYFKATPY
uniref:Cellular repressor of E1A-stimulated genes 2 n=1 Tax=Oncorhynchus mykiss TaxID=8022 RepID=A0A8C7NGF7_ONCMY